MELVNIVLRTSSRLVAFIVIGLVLYGAWTISSTFEQEGFIAIFTGLAFLICWIIYNKVIGNLEGDLSVLIRLVQVRGAGALSSIKEVIGSTIDSRLQKPEFIESHYELVEWKDVESGSRIRRKLSESGVTCLIGQKDGKPQFMDMVDVGAVYISAPPRSGKTSLIIQMIASIMLGHPMTKRDIDFYFIDITRDLSLLAPLGKYTSNMKEAHQMLVDIGKEIDRRNVMREKYELGGDYWYKIPLEHRPRTTIVVIDEAIQVLKEGGNSLKDAWSKIINIGHKNGILLITTTLYTRGDLIPTEFTSLMRAKIAGYMGTEQAFINMLDSDYYNKHRQSIEEYVNTKYRFALCIRPHKPTMFQPVYVPPQRLLELVQESVINPDDTSDVALSYFWNSRGNISSEELARKTREFVERNGTGKTKPETIHKKSMLELLRYAVLAGVAVHSGEREKYRLDESITSYGIMLKKWTDFVLQGGLDKRVPSGEDMVKLNG